MYGIKYNINAWTNDSHVRVQPDSYGQSLHDSGTKLKIFPVLLQ